MKLWTFSTITQELRRRFDHAALPQSAREAELLVADLLHLARNQPLLTPEKTLSEDQVELLFEGASRRLAGEPLAYIAGYAGFLDLELAVGKGVLIPRPETEELALLTIEWANNYAPIQPLTPSKEPYQALDLATGSGALAIALARSLPNWQLHASDISSEALAYCQTNSDLLAQSIDRPIDIRQGSWFEPWNGYSFDLIISNPPYVGSDEIGWISRETLDFEPSLALFGGEDGLDPYRLLAEQSNKYLRSGGLLALEIGWRQASSVEELFRLAGWCNPRVKRDLSGHPRFFFIERE